MFIRCSLLNFIYPPTHIQYTSINGVINDSLWTPRHLNPQKPPGPWLKDICDPVLTSWTNCHGMPRSNSKQRRRKGKATSLKYLSTTTIVLTFFLLRGLDPLIFKPFTVNLGPDFLLRQRGRRVKGLTRTAVVPRGLPRQWRIRTSRDLQSLFPETWTHWPPKKPELFQRLGGIRKRS